ncbi:MAG TPA: nitrogen fixation protein NifQ [Burkholderiales bacterium]|nr:nitrogen fixation protein NifQ [Burkholderiales bacterium]
MPPDGGPATLLALARNPADLRAVALAGVIGEALRAGRAPLIRGLEEDGFQRLLARHFPGASLANGAAAAADPALDEFEDLVALLLEHAADDAEDTRWLALAVASASLGDNHLWQDMGLPSRRELNELLRRWFPSLHARNAGDMKWKKFFYRQLCERAEVLICRSPSCAVCADYRHCFGPETADAGVVEWMPRPS